MARDLPPKPFRQYSKTLTHDKQPLMEHWIKMYKGGRIDLIPKDLLPYVESWMRDRQNQE